MIEAAMYMALGILAAGLVALVLIPPFWRRAIRLNRRDIEATLPMTRAEIDADKDQLRAGFAVSTRQLETEIERLGDRIATREVEMGQKREIITHLTVQGSLTAEGIGALEKERDQLLSTLAIRDRQIAEIDEARKGAEKRILDIEARLEAARQQLEAVVAEREAHRLELVARDTELGNLRDRIAADARAAGETALRADELAELRTQLASEQIRREAAIEQARADEAGRRALEVELRAGAITLAAAKEDLAEARLRIEALSSRLVEAEATGMSLAAVREERTALAARVATLEAVNTRLEASEAAAPTSAPAAGDTAALRQKLLEIGDAVAMLARPVSQVASQPEPAPEAVDRASVVPMLPAPPATISGPGERPIGSMSPVGLAERIRALQTSKAG